MSFTEGLIALLSLTIPLLFGGGFIVLIVRLYRRIRQLEARVQQLEDERTPVSRAHSRTTASRSASPSP